MNNLFLVAYDSFANRSMATFLKTDINIFIDPSIAIAPKRYNLDPHIIELQTLELYKKKIKDFLYNTDLILISHYHWDHCPEPKRDIDLLEILRNKIVILKDPFSKINHSQKNRSKEVLFFLNKQNNTILYGDSKEFEFGNTFIKVSNPVYHGEEKSPLGYVNMFYIAYKQKTILFSSDIQGVLSETTKQEILSLDPFKIWILSGPPTYINKISEKELSLSIKNISKISLDKNVKIIIIDHHLLRDLRYFIYISKLKENLKEYDIQILTAAEFMGFSNLQLEANRKKLYNN